MKARMRLNRRQGPPAPQAAPPTKGHPDHVARRMVQLIEQFVQRRAAKREALLFQQPADLTLAEAAQGLGLRVSYGNVADDLEERETWSGIRSTSGVIQLETTAEVAPYEARGMGAGTGLFWDLQATPEVGSALGRLRRIATGTALRLEPPQLPPGASDAEHASAELQFALAQRWFYTWENAGMNADLSAFVHTATWIAPLMGFCLFELVGEERTETVMGVEIEHLAPKVPTPIMPWTVRQWVSLRGELLGIIADFSGCGDVAGSGSFAQFVDASKLLHVICNPLADNWEGRSVIRDCFRQVQMLRDLYQLQALGAEVHALGELWFTQQGATLTADGNAPITPEQEDQLAALLDNRAAVYIPGAVLPPGVGVEYGKSRENVPDLSPLITTLRQAVAMVLDAEERLMGTEDTGTFAARKEAGQGNRDGLDFTLWHFVAKPIQEVLKRFLALAFPDATIYTPRLAWGVVQTRDPKEWVETVSAAKQGGLLDDPVIGPVVREELDLPPLPAVEEDSGPAVEASISPLEQVQQARLAGADLNHPFLGDHLRGLLGLPLMTEQERALALARWGSVGATPNVGGPA